MSSVSEKPQAKTATFDPVRVRADFPVLTRQVHGKPLVYLDNGATAQKPTVVIDRMARFYREGNANIHRGVHLLSVEATEAYEAARRDAGLLLGGPPEGELVFTKGATEAFNLVARSFVRPLLSPGDEILLTEMEHHANIVPWQIVAAEAGARVLACPITDAGEIDEKAFEGMLGSRTRMVSLVHVSNVLGTVNPVKRLAALARDRGIPVMIDGAQAIPHFPVDVASLGCDFYTFSGHKVFGPTGIGLLWGRRELLEKMEPYQGGGDMIDKVAFEGTTFRPPPERFEAGTPPIAAAIGLGEAARYFRGLDAAGREAHEHALFDALEGVVSGTPGAILYGRAPERLGVVSFNLEGIHPHDLGTLADSAGVAIRVGHHCAQPLMRRLGVTATARASIAFYNTVEEIDALGDVLRRARKLFS